MYYLANSGRTLVILRVWNKKCPEWAPHVCGDGALTVSGHSRYNPAYAGILLFAPHPVWRLWIQPRVCGDTCQIDARVMRPSDTTPRMRGYFTKHPPTRAFLRYNPAYAGILWAASLLIRYGQMGAGDIGDFVHKKYISSYRQMAKTCDYLRK